MKKIINSIFYGLSGLLLVGGSFLAIIGFVQKGKPGAADILVAVGVLAALAGLILLIIYALIHRFLLK